MLLSKGCSGIEVYQLQRKLNLLDPSLHPDGIFGAHTEEVLKKAQAAKYITGSILAEEIDKIVSESVTLQREEREVFSKYPLLDSGKISSRGSYNPSKIVIHDSGTPTFKETTDYWVKGKQPVSCHFIIDYDGKVCRSVPIHQAAWHSGMLKDPYLDQMSIGVVLLNWGRLKKETHAYVHSSQDNLIYESSIYGSPQKDEYLETYMPYTREQYENLVTLTKEINAIYKIEDILYAPRVRVDSKGQEGVFPLELLKGTLPPKG